MRWHQRASATIRMKSMSIESSTRSVCTGSSDNTEGSRYFLTAPRRRMPVDCWDTPLDHA